MFFVIICHKKLQVFVKKIVGVVGVWRLRVCVVGLRVCWERRRGGGEEERESGREEEEEGKRVW